MTKRGSKRHQSRDQSVLSFLIRFLCTVLVLRADVCKYRPEVGKIKFLKNPQKIM